MSWRVVRASAVLELRRGWPTTVKLLIGIAACGAVISLAPRLPMFFAGFVSLVLGLVGMSIGAATAMRERMMGRVVWWRTLPASRSQLVGGRIIGAGISALLLPVALMPLVVAASRSEFPLPGIRGLVAGFVVIGLLAMAIAVVVTGAALKLKVEYLFLVAIMSSFIDDMVFGGRIGDWIEPLAKDLGTRFLAAVDGSQFSLLVFAALLVLVVAVALGSLLMHWSYATAVDVDRGQLTAAASGISRFTWRGVRYPRGRQGAVLAVTWLQLRLVAERLPQQLGLLVAGALVLPWLPETPAHFVAIYLPITALGIPGGIVARTALGKSTGALEGIATLPVARERIAIANVLAIAMATLIATAAVAMLRGSAGSSFSPPMAFAVWGLTTGSVSIGNGMAAWFKPRHFGIVAVVAVCLLAGLTFAMIPFILSPQAAGAAAIKLPALALGAGLVGLLLLAPLGGALYGRGLERFELIRK